MSDLKSEKEMIHFPLDKKFRGKKKKAITASWSCLSCATNNTGKEKTAEDYEKLDWKALG